MADGRHQGVLFGRQVVQVLGSGFAGVDFVFHAIQTGHQQRREAQVGVGHGIGEAGFHATAFGVGHKRNADRGRAVLGGVSQLDRGFKAGHQTLVAVGGRVGDGVQGTGVLDDATDVVQGVVGQACVAVAGKQVFTVFPNGLVHVHARTVVTHQRLGHEGRGFAVGVGHIPDHVLQALGPVGAFDQCAELGADFILTCARHFVVEHFNGDADGFEDQRHFGAHVLRAVHGRHGEIAALDGGTVAAVAAFEFGTGVPGGFVFFNFKHRARHVVLPTHAVKDEELGFGTEVSGVAQARSAHESFRTLGDGTGVTVIGLAVGRFQHIAGQNQGGFFKEGIDNGGIVVGHQQHVGGLNAFPTGDGRTIKSMTRRELVFVKM